MGDRKRLLAHVLALAGLAAALLLPWWHAAERGHSIDITLLGGEVCTPGGCAALRLGPDILGPIATLTFIAGLLAAVATLLSLILTTLGKMPRAIALGCAIACTPFVLCTIATILSFDDTIGAFVDLNLWSGFAGAVVGGGLGVLAPRAAVAPAPIEIAPSLRRPDAERPALPTTPAPAANIDYQRAINAATRPERDGRNVASRGTARAAVDSTRSALRFVVTTGELDDAGLVVRTDDGAERRVGWDQIATVVVRRMPPDPPFEKTLLLDLVPRQGAPLRLLQSSRLDYRQLPGGAAATARENFRKLVALARQRHPEIVLEQASVAFLSGGGEPPIFGSMRLFAEYDGRYQ